VTSLDGATLGTGMTPDRPRLPNTAYAAGDGPGIGYYDSVGTFKLYEAVKEFPSTGAC
jgi:hypothetical protein